MDGHITFGGVFLVPDTCNYASGEQPERGDCIHHAEEDRFNTNEENKHCWFVMSIAGEMVRCKCEGAEVWRQAFYIAQMRLIHRKPNKGKGGK